MKYLGNVKLCNRNMYPKYMKNHKPIRKKCNSNENRGEN